MEKTLKKATLKLRCPFGKCGRDGYPQPTWKTVAGLEKHKETCHLNPEVMAGAAERERKAEQAASDKAAREALYIAAFLDSTPPDLSVGQTVYYIHERIVAPTHVEKFGRMVRVRYEAIKSFSLGVMVIQKISARIGYDLNCGHVFIAGSVEKGRSEIILDQNEAERQARERQADYDEHVKFSQLCR